MKTTTLLLTLLLTTTLFSQSLQSRYDDKSDTVMYLSLGLDPAVLVGLNKVEKVSLDYTIGFGIESYKTKGVGLKLGVYHESFKAINYRSYTLQGGITFKAFRGLYSFITPELNLINRKGLKDSKLYNANDVDNYSLGLNFGLRANEVFNTPFSLEWVFNGKGRPDIITHYGFGDKVVFSTYVNLVYNF